MRKRTKIIATLGPSSSSSKVITNLIKEGTDVFRINLSHASVDQIAKVISILKSASNKLNRPIATLIDLQGQKIRITSFKTKKFRIAKAYDGKEALEIYKTKKFKYIISDWEMPIMNGVELATNVK